MSIFKTLNHLYSNFFMEFLKDPSLVLHYSSYTPLLSVLSYLIHQQTTSSVLMILSFSYYSHFSYMEQMFSVNFNIGPTIVAHETINNENYRLFTEKTIRSQPQETVSFSSFQCIIFMR